MFTGDRNDDDGDDDDMIITSDEERDLINEIQDDDTEDLLDDITGQLEVYRLVLLASCMCQIKHCKKSKV